MIDAEHTSENVCEKIEMRRVYSIKTEMATKRTMRGAPKSFDSSSASSNPKKADPKNTCSSSHAISPYDFVLSCSPYNVKRTRSVRKTSLDFNTKHTILSNKQALT